MTKKNFLAIIALALGMVLCMFSVGCGGTGDSGNSSSSGTEDSSSTGGGTVEHTHTLVKVDAKAATCGVAGNKEYYECSGCGLLFSDAEGNNETTAADILLAKTGEHDYRLDPAVEPDKTSIGNEEHYFCAECGQNATKGANGEYIETDRKDWDVYYDYIKEIVQGGGKLKHMDQGVADRAVYQEVEKDGKTVVAAYFSNNTPWVEEGRQYDDDSNKWNWGFSEFRINVSGDITGISFDYKIDGTTEGYCNMVNTADKSHGTKHVIEYRHSSGTYDNVTRNGVGMEFLILDGEWHTFTLDVSQNNMENILLKLYHFQGEMWVTNYHVYFA